MNVTVRGQTRHYRTVSFDAERNAVLLIEQRLLPHEFKIVETRGEIDGISHIASRNSDGLVSLILTNPKAAQSVQIACGIMTATLQLPPDSITTLRFAPRQV